MAPLGGLDAALEGMITLAYCGTVKDKRIPEQCIEGYDFNSGVVSAWKEMPHRFMGQTPPSGILM